MTDCMMNIFYRAVGSSLAEGFPEGLQRSKQKFHSGVLVQSLVWMCMHECMVSNMHSNYFLGLAVFSDNTCSSDVVPTHEFEDRQLTESVSC